ncbi:MFS family permease [Kineococcus radiotolerans]|uniref:MFS family permease n=1 Tax=Kineococcus radiotolerans TaxID=131568 RepID=A0A7W4XYP7_KINRA|nr:MFS transporter [Kineococcus radiotolerans]MBB2903376.1 MFS family permease [Kineococcus radiotolerans]
MSVAVACLGMMMSFLTITATVSALASIQADLHLSPVQLVWTSSAYALAVAALVLSSGSLGDLLGRRTAFQAGTAIIGAGAVLTATAGSPAAVIVGEVVMGAGAALVVPNSLAIVSSAFPDATRRASAVGVWAACSGIGLAIGPLSAGLLLNSFTWHAVFLVNVVVAVLVLILSALTVPNTRVPGRGLDVPGSVLATLAIAALVVGVVDGGRTGFRTPLPIATFALALLAALAFVAVERRHPRPVLHLAAFTSASSIAALLIAAVSLFTFTGIALLATLQMQRALGYAPLESGARSLPLMGAYVLVSSAAAAAVRRVGVRVVLTTGLAATFAGVLLLHQVQVDSPFALTALAYALTGGGLGLLIAPTTALVVGAVPPQQAGMASAAVTTVRQVGAALGGSVLGTVVTSRLPAHTAVDPQHPAAAFTAAVHDGLLVAAAVLLITLVMAQVLLRSPRHLPRHRVRAAFAPIPLPRPNAGVPAQEDEILTA